jgi:uncharacterized protein (DUF2164 family)
MKAPTHTYLAERLKKLYSDPTCIVDYEMPSKANLSGKIKITLTTNLDKEVEFFDPYKEFVLIGVYGQGITLDHHYAKQGKVTDADEYYLYENIKDIDELLEKIMKFVASELGIVEAF